MILSIKSSYNRKSNKNCGYSTEFSPQLSHFLCSKHFAKRSPLFCWQHPSILARLSASEYDHRTKGIHTYKHEQRQLELKTLNIERIILYSINPILSLVGRSVSVVACLFGESRVAQMSAYTQWFTVQSNIKCALFSGLA